MVSRKSGRTLASLLLGAALVLGACGGGGGGGRNSAADPVTATGEVPVIRTHPLSFTVLDGMDITFSVVATGGGPFSYQWQRNGTDVPGATASSYTLSDPRPADSGSVWRVRVSNGAGTVYSNPATLTVRGAPTASVRAGALSGAGSADGKPGQISFACGLVADRAGNTYLADTQNHTVRRMAADGTLSTLAGKAGSPGHVDGQGSGARFRAPQALAIDGNDVLYVADAFDHTIRKITPSGAVSTLAGQPGSYLHTDGRGSAAHFYEPKNRSCPHEAGSDTRQGKGLGQPGGVTQWVSRS